MKSMRIGEVAQEAGVNIDTIRYYERRGLLEEPGRRPSGYRVYGVEAVQIIRFIRRAQDLGFTLDEIQDLLRLRTTTRGKRDDVRALAQAKVRDISLKVAQLTAMKEALEVLLTSCACKTGEPECPILEALDDPKPLLTIGRRPKDVEHARH
jgi:MerR family copper efflux transcriptional regulator